MTRGKLIYLDNAATSFPKPPEVVEAVRSYMTEVGSNPGRSGHRLSVEAARTVYRTRENIARLFAFPDPLRVVFTQNITEALNLVLRGLLRRGNHVVTTAMEHNSVMRPLRDLEKIGVELSLVPVGPRGELRPDDFDAAVKANTTLFVLNHGSNVHGAVVPLRDIGRIARKRNLLLVADTAQTAGVLPIDMEEDHIDILCFTGHKGLLGPTGTGGFLLGSRVPEGFPVPLKSGGTGSRSDREEQPDFLPDMYECGTLNAAGLAGLLAGTEWILGQGLEAIREKEKALLSQLMEGITAIPEIRIYAGTGAADMTATISIDLEGMEPSELGERLDEDYGIMTRAGLHCAPAAHKTLGTYPRGTIRLSPGFFTREEDIDTTIRALRELAGENRKKQ